jgi:NAD(P)-dependent dehydrogenase (short-subunit alcohol dehydrogenase family)
MKKYLIIGASSGIGKQLAISLRQSGDKVLGTYNTQKAGESSGIEFYHLNVLDEEIDLSFVPDNLDGLVYCPGSINLKPFHRIKPQQFNEDFNLQVTGAIKVIQAVLSNLQAGDGGSVVLFSTVAVQQGFSFHTQVSASKGAIEGLSKALSAELAPSVRVNCIAPSVTNTPLASKLLGSDDKVEKNAARHPLKRIGQPSDIANAAEFLLSDMSGWITGQVIHVDGGMSSIRM